MRPVATINTQALTHNLTRVKRSAPEAKVISVIKANAYGHGILPVAQALDDSDYFAVARLEEALYLREQGIAKTILLLEGVYAVEDYELCTQLQFIPVVHCLQQLYDLHDYCLQSSDSQKEVNSVLEYWLKCDTGMHRIGLSADELPDILKLLKKINSNCLFSGLMSHFSCADDIDNPINSAQLIQFKQFYGQLIENRYLKPEYIKSCITKSMANSAAIMALPEAHFDWLRPGIMLYGVSPFESSKPQRTGLDEQLLPVMTLSAPLISIKGLKKGDCIGYGANWCCPRDMNIGVIGIGYGDGYPRHAPSGTPVLLHNIEVPLVGRVSMDMITVDLTALEEKSIALDIGDKAILWGDGLPVEKISQRSGTIAYELLCQITQRVSFNYV